MNGVVERFDERRGLGGRSFGRTVVREGELVRHPPYTRVLHWGVAIFFILALLSGLALYNSWLYRALTPLFGGGAMTRLLHPWFSLGFVAFFLFQFLNWSAPMAWTADDRRWIRQMKSYITNAEEVEPEYVDFFNAGQKVYFWAITVSAVVFLVTGLLMWFPDISGRIAVAISYVLHDVAALVMLGGFIAHVYEVTAAQPGTFRSMTRGTVEGRWAWTHHPAWFRRRSGGHDARADHDRAPSAPAQDPGTR